METSSVHTRLRSDAVYFTPAVIETEKEKQITQIAAQSLEKKPSTSSKSFTAKVSTKTSSSAASFLLFHRSLTWVQTEARKALSLLSTAVKSAPAFLYAGVAGGGLAVLTFSYVAATTFKEGVQILLSPQGKASDAALKISGSLGAGISAVGALDATFKAITVLWKHVNLSFLGHLGGVICAGIGPFVAASLDFVGIMRLNSAGKKLAAEIAAIKNYEEHPTEELSRLTKQERAQKLEVLELDLRINKRDQRVKALKIIGSLAFAAVQVALALGTGGLSIGVMAAIGAAYLLVSYGIEWLHTRKAQEEEALLSQRGVLKSNLAPA